jgi:hypothetical protein
MHPSPDRLLDAALPRWDVMEQHARVVPAPPDAVWHALHAVRMQELRLTRGLVAVRTLGRHGSANLHRRVLDALPPGELASRAPHELLLGLVAPTSLRLDVGSVAALRPVDLDDFGRPLHAVARRAESAGG